MRRCLLLTQSGHSPNPSLTIPSRLISPPPRTQVATSRCINLHLIDAPKEGCAKGRRRVVLSQLRGCPDWGGPSMCDYSLHSVKSRPAKVGDKLTTQDFG